MLGHPILNPPSRSKVGSVTASLLLVLLLIRILLQPFLRSLIMFHQPLASAIRSNSVYLAAALAAAACLCGWLWANWRRNAHTWPINWPVFLLGLAILWPIPMIVDPGEVTNVNWVAQLRAAILARNAVFHGEFPGFTFQQGNGASYLTQYPPLATWLETLPMILGIQPELGLKLTGVLLHLVAVSGLYCLMRRCGAAELPAAAGAVCATLTQQYWITGMLTGSLGAWCGFALMPWATLAMISLISQPSVQESLTLGSLCGLLVFAYPGYALFLSYFVVIALLVGGFWVYRKLYRAMPFLILAGAVSVCVGSPYLIPLFLYRPYNLYRPDWITEYSFPLPVFSRTLIWSPRIGSPPGVGLDFTGYIGAILWLSLLIAPWLLMSPKFSNQIQKLRLGIFVAWTSLAVLLIYGSKLPLYRYIPYVYPNKTPNRFYPFLAIVLAAGFAICCERLRTRPRWLALLITIAVLEQLPFCTRSYFFPAEHMASALDGIMGHDSRREVLSADPNVYDRVYRAATLDGVNDFYYVHHEEIGAAGRLYWEISDPLRNRDCSALERGLREKLRWVGATHLFFSEAPASCFAALGVPRTVLVDSIPSYVVEIDSNAIIDRHISTIVIPAEPNGLASGRQLLPISFNPRLTATQGGRRLQLFNTQGFAEVCCLSQSDREPITVVHAWPFVYYAAYLLSFCTLLLSALLLLRPAQSHANPRNPLRATIN